MIQNYVLTTLRSFKKDAFYTAINALGLTVSLACAFLLILYVTEELSFDRFHSKSDRIYRVVSHISEPDKSFSWSVTQPPAAPQIQSDYSDIESVVRFFPRGVVTFSQDGKEYAVQDVYAADSTVFSVFDYGWIRGDASTSLLKPNSVVLTRDAAIQIFGTDDVVGKSIKADDRLEYQVTGVMENVPRNAHFRFGALFSLDAQARNNNGWGGFFVTTYLLFKPEADVAGTLAKMPEMYDKYMATIFGRMNIKIQYDLQKLTDIHLHSHLEGETNGDIAYVYIFSAIAVFLLVIAGINYMNLATARSSRRSKEVGIRKVLGSNRTQIAGQFLSESVLMALLALLVSYGVVWLSLPFFNSVSGKYFISADLLSMDALLILLGMVFIVGIAGGSYPAFYLSAFNPVGILRNQMAQGKGAATLRRSLIVVQFTISMIMLSSTLVVYDQLQFMRNKDMGYDKSGVISVPLPRGQVRTYQAFRDELIKIPGVMAVSSANQQTSDIGGRIIFTVEGANGMEEKGFRPFAIDHHYVEAMGMTIVKGRNFSLDFPSDTLQAVIINEQMAERMNWDNPIGKKVRIGGNSDQNTNPFAEVVGVVRDFHQQSLYSVIEPMVVLYRRQNPVVHVRLTAQNISDHLKQVEAAFKTKYPGAPFQYEFLEDAFENAYRADANRGTVFTVFTAITLIIACLGLLGLASFTAERRRKEIGIRKVIGAEVPHLMLLMTRDFVILLAISSALAFPAAWYAMNGWLEGFPYRTSIGTGVFVITLIATLLVTLLAVSYHTLMAAKANPVHAIKAE